MLGNGKTLSLEGSRLVTWMANPATGTCAVDDNGLLTLSNDAKGVVQACMALTDDQVCTAFAAVDGSMASPTVTCTAGAGGTLSVTATLNGSNAVESSADGVYTIKKGATVTITPTPSSGYELSALQVDGVTVTLTNGSYTISNLQNAIRVYAAFQQTTEEPEDPGTPGGGSSGGGSTNPTYTVTVSNTTNGSVSVTPANAAQGTLVTLTVSPADGYVLEQLTVTDAAGKPVALSQKSANQYTFTMPAGKVSVTASFVQESASAGVTFIDVKEGDWFYEAVQFVVSSGMMNGTGNNSFQPGINLSRSMIATILWRLEDAPTGDSARFTDVPNGQWYTDAVNWAAANDLVNGYGNSTFGPEDDITREQMAAILYRYAQFKGYDHTVQGDLSRFADGGQTSDWAREAVVWAVDNGLLTGKGGGLLDPKGTATRAEVATILMRFVENISQ